MEEPVFIKCEPHSEEYITDNLEVMKADPIDEFDGQNGVETNVSAVKEKVVIQDMTEELQVEECDNNGTLMNDEQTGDQALTANEKNRQRITEHNSRSSCRKLSGDQPINSENGWFSCCVCGLDFNKEIRERPYLCTDCPTTFAQLEDSRNQTVAHSGIKPYYCFPCGKKFSGCAGLGESQPIKRQYSCAICKKVFSANRSLNRHLFVHSNEMSYTCSMCEKKFKTRDAMVRHLVYHTGTRSHSCSVCEKSFYRSKDLRKHMRFVHTDTKPFQCSTCFKRFKQHVSLKDHMLLHTTSKPYSCPSCAQQFGYRRSLQRHIARHR